MANIVKSPLIDLSPFKLSFEGKEDFYNRERLPIEASKKALT